jgi:hypothetical protein
MHWGESESCVVSKESESLLVILFNSPFLFDSARLPVMESEPFALLDF